MKIKKTVWLVACIAASAAHAQSSVTLYGSIDVGVAYVNNAGGASKVFMEQGESQPDRWGLYGVEHLGGGLSTEFRLENGFYTNSGAMASPSTLWNRQAWVGLVSESIGTLRLGRQTPFSFDWLSPFSTAYQSGNWFAFHPGNIDQLADTSVVPYNNAARYISPSFHGLTVGAMMGLGNTTNFGYGRNLSAAVKYDLGAFHATAVYQDEHNRTPTITTVTAPTFGGLPAASYTADSTEEEGFGASYDLGAFKLHAMYTRVKLTTAGISELFQSYDGGVNYRVSPASLIGFGGATTTLAGSRYTQFSLGYNYSLSKATQVYADTNFERASGDNARAALYTAGISSTSNQLSFKIGMHHSF
ncbi:porin [Paraburkholderia xenovorans]|uniref:porin n=1 Tax=Paraburkholderia xenovorans TaxID=36873 RepID=UPI0038B9AF67